VGNQRPELDAATLRETRDGLLKAVQDQRRDVGVPVPDERTAAEFIDPIMRKVEVDNAESRIKDLTRPPRKPAPEQDGEWLGEPDHAPKLTEIPGTVTTYSTGSAGTALLTPGGPAIYKPAAPWDRPRTKHGPNTDAMLQRIRELKALPEWRKRLEKILFANETDDWKASQYLKVLKDSVRLFGDPRVVKEKKILVGV